MSKTIYIGGRLESKEKGNVVTGANAILDDTKGKKQNVINKETDDELARLEQSKQDNLNFDNTPTEDSTNPVTSGGVYTAEKALSDAIEAILLLIPSAATALNKLVDTNTMNSSISTATATFRGTYNAVSDLGLTYQATHAQIEAALDALGLTADNNDFAFVQIPVSDQSQDIAKTERFKFNGTNWLYEYDLNTSGFTAAQWAAINSGITVALVTKLTDLPTAAALQLALNAKQDTLTFDNEPTALSQNPVTSGGIYTAIQAVATALSDYSTTTDGRLNVLEGLVPTEASSSNKLTDKAYVDGLIQAITELIPAEADTTNQLADKAYVLAQILAATPAFKGQFVTLAELQAVASPKAGDLGIVRTKDSDGMDVFTVYQYLNNAWNVFFSLSYHPQTKPATTGTTGDYPYNGMGRVELPMNIVEGVNTLTQSMMPVATGGNTIYIIRYDFTLGEDITVPANCVLEFDGGSISGAYTLTGTNTIFMGNVKCFVTIAGTFANEELCLNWFLENENTSIHTVANNLINILSDSVTVESLYKNCILSIKGGTYNLSGTIFIRPFSKLRADGAVLIKSTVTSTAIVIRPTANDIAKMDAFDEINSYNAKPYYNGDIIQGNNTLTLMAVNPYLGNGIWLGSYGDVEPLRNIVTNIRISGLSIIGFGTGIHIVGRHLYNIVFDHLEVQRCNHAIVTDKARWGSGFEGVLNWDEHISIVNSLFGDKSNGSDHGNFLFMYIDTALHIENTSIDGFDTIFDTSEDYQASIRAHISNCHLEANGKEATSSVESAGGIASYWVSESSVIHITNTRFVFSTSRQGIILPNNKAEVYFDNITFNCTKNDVIYDGKWAFISLQSNPLNIKQSSRPLMKMGNGFRFRPTPCLCYYNNIIPNGLCNDIIGAGATLQTLKEGYSYKGFKFTINAEATIGSLGTTPYSIFGNERNYAFVLGLASGSASEYTIETPTFNVKRLGRYGFNQGITYTTLGAEPTENLRLQITLTKVIIKDDNDNILEEITTFDGETQGGLVWLEPNKVYWPAYTTPFNTKNDAVKAQIVYKLSIPSTNVGGQVRFYGVYAEEQD